MAIQQFDAFGNYTGGYGLLDGMETEEERRRRLAKEASNTLVGKTEVETYADGSQTRTVTQEIPAAQPLGQGIQVAGPMDPETFNRMIQAESGGQQFNRQGGVLTSPKGALGLGQVMPATAAQPGYGVPSIFELAERRGIAVPSRDQAGAAQLLANPELNREFAQLYANAMSQRFGQQGGVAAYNAGPGRVQSNMQANAGQLNPQALPQETQGYLGRVLGTVRRGAEAVASAVIPSAQAATPPATGPVDPAEQRRRAALAQRPPLPGSAGSQAAADQVYQGAAAPAPAQAAPVAEPVSPYSLAAGVPPSQGLRVPGMPVGQTAQPSTQAIDLYQQIQDDPMELFRLRRDESQPQFIRERAGSRAYELLDAEVKRKEGEAQAQQLAAAAAGGDRRASMTLAKELQKQEGSWLKFALLGFISPDMAGEEAVKLGFGNRWVSDYDENGKRVLVERNAKGLPLRGFDSEGNALDPSELVAYGGQATKRNVTKTETMIDPESGQVVNKMVMSDATEKYTVGGKPFTGNKNALVPEARYTEAENRRVNTAIEALRRNVPNPTQDQIQQALIQARVPNRRIELEMGLPEGSLGAGTGRVAVGEVTGARPAVTGGADTGARPAAAATGGAPTGGAPTGGAPTGTTQAQPAATPARPATAQITPDTQPQPPAIRQPRAGESKQEYDAYVKQENDAYQKRLEAFQNKVKLEQQEAQRFRDVRFDARNTISKFRNAVDIIDSGKHNLGPNFSVSGAGPLPRFQQWFGEQFGTDDSVNTTIIRGLISREGLQDIKTSMGPAISNFDVQTWMRTNPVNERMPPEAIKAWIIKTHNAILAEAEGHKANAIKHGMVEPSFSLGSPISGDRRPPLDSFRR